VVLYKDRTEKFSGKVTQKNLEILDKKFVAILSQTRHKNS